MEQVNGKSCRFLSREHPGFSLSCDLVVTVIIVQSLDLVDLGSTDAIDTAFAVGIGGVSDIKHFPKVCVFCCVCRGTLLETARDERQNFDAQTRSRCMLGMLGRFFCQKLVGFLQARNL